MGARNYICIRARAIFLYIIHPLVILAVLLVLQKYLIKNERDEDSGVGSPDANSRFSDEGSSNIKARKQRRGGTKWTSSIARLEGGLTRGSRSRTQWRSRSLFGPAQKPTLESGSHLNLRLVTVTGIENAFTIFGPICRSMFLGSDHPSPLRVQWSGFPGTIGTTRYHLDTRIALGKRRK